MIQKKICMIGSPAVGKTSVVRRYVQGMFSDDYLATIGVKIDRKVVQIDDQEITMLLWDIAGDDAFQPLKISYLRGMSGYFLVVDGTRKSTLDHAVRLQDRVDAEHGDLPFVLLLNKRDLVEEWDMRDEMLAALRGRGWEIRETSALEGDGVDEAFITLAMAMLNTPTT